MKSKITDGRLGKTLCFVILLFISVSAYSQSFPIQGVVTNADGPVIGAIINVKGGSVGAVTDIDGSYQLEANLNDVLVFNYISHFSKEVTVLNGNRIDVFLEQDNEELEEIVVIGYGTAKKSDVPGSISSVKAEELDKTKPVSFEGGLAARASGVQVTQSEGGPGSGFKVRIRGGSSINASNDPLYVIDGFALPGNPVGNANGIGNSTSSPLSTIDPSTIESVEILKDAAATAIYGSRGANGVVLITTKSGKQDRNDLSFEAFTSFSALSNQIDLLTGQEFVDWRLEFSPWNPNQPGDQFARAYRDQYGNAIDLNDPRVIITDWQDEITRVANAQNYQLSFSGGAAKTNYAGSFSYLDQEGIIETSDFRRFAGNLKLNQVLSDKFKGGISLNMGYNTRNGVVSASTENANGRSGIITNSILFSPVQGLTRLPGAEYDENGLLLTLRDGDITNPTRTLEENTNSGNNFQTFGNIYLQYDFNKYLNFKSSVRGNIYANRGQAYYTEKFGWGSFSNGRAFRNVSEGNGFVTEQNLSFNKQFDGYRINATAVYEQQENKNTQTAVSATGFNLPGVNLDNLASATTTLPTQTGFNDFTLRSYLARVQFGIADRYNINLSGRYDGSSRFAEGNKYGFFPSAGFVWKAANEKFMENSKFSDLNVKVSYGETGNTQIGSYRSIASGRLANYILDGSQLATGVAIERLGNSDLTWETTRQFDAGFSVGLFNNKINLTADYYQKNTRDLLLEVPLPTTSGFTFSFANLGEVKNSGFELALNSFNIDNGDFTWETNFNISFNDNEVLDLGDASEFFVTSLGDNQIQNDYVIREGESLGSVYGLQVGGVYNYADFAAFDGMSDQEAAAKIRADAAAQNIPYFDVFYALKEGIVMSGQPDRNLYRPGMTKYVDQNGDLLVNDADRTIIGNTFANFYGGLNNNLSYKNFDFSILASFTSGNDVYNKNLARLNSQAIPYFNKSETVANRWTPENPNTNVEGIWGLTDSGLIGNSYSSYIEDGSFVRINNMTLGYKLPQATMNKIGVKSLRIYGAVDNAFLFSGYSGYDPDVSVGNNQLTPGLDSDSYPRARTFRFGLNINL